MGLIVPVVTLGTDALDSQIVVAFIASIIVAGIWTAYLSKSERVRNTYRLPSRAVPASYEDRALIDAINLPDQQMSQQGSQPLAKANAGNTAYESGPDAGNKRQTSDLAPPLNEEALYERIANEIESGSQNKGLWTKCFVESEGDEAKTKVSYIRARMAQLVDEEHERLRRAEEALEQAKLQELAGKEARALFKEDCITILSRHGYSAQWRDKGCRIDTPTNAYVHLSSLKDLQDFAAAVRDEPRELQQNPILNAWCPACMRSISPLAVICRHCGAKFGGDAAWRPIPEPANDERTERTIPTYIAWMILAGLYVIAILVVSYLSKPGVLDSTMLP